MIVEFQAIQTTSSSMSTVSLGAYDNVQSIPLPGMRVRLRLSGPDAPFNDGDEVYGFVATAPETTIYVPQTSIDAMVFLQDVQPV